MHRGVDGDAALLEGDVVVEDVGEREEALGRGLGAVGLKRWAASERKAASAAWKPLSAR